ncbi:MAG: DNA repair protein RecO [Candidatus Solibacter usitatus]|nr:DNA repair protein RecO [Candidatus Solibacter usitatus]
MQICAPIFATRSATFGVNATRRSSAAVSFNTPTVTPKGGGTSTCADQAPRRGVPTFPYSLDALAPAFRYEVRKDRISQASLSDISRKSGEAVCANLKSYQTPVPARISEAFVLRSFPFGEADLVVSYLTRDQGKLRGVAKRARRPKSPFGSGLERLSLVRMQYFQRENRELTTLDSCELIQSSFLLQGSYEAGITLDFLSEVTDELLPQNEANERHFRLLASVLEFLRERREDPSAIWPAALYFALWAVRLAGVLPALRVKAESIEIANEMFLKPIKELTPRVWSRQTAADLRHFLTRAIEEQTERSLRTVPMLETL